MKVIKFGGSSLADATQIQKVYEIVKSDPERRIVIVSAPGKRSSSDTKVTDLLIKLAQLRIEDEDGSEVKSDILSRYQLIADELSLGEEIMTQIERHFDKLERTTFDSIGLLEDAYKASGEDNNAKLIAAFFQEKGLRARYVNPKEAGIFVTSEAGNAQILPESYNFLSSLRDTEDILVIPGFFGYNENDQVVTFSRGGSDITGAIVASGVRADVYENFTDVDAIFVANPNHVENPAKISHLTYSEMRELSYAGFSVFHDEALLPAFSSNIPVHVKNTNNPTCEGTLITNERPRKEKILSGIASSSGFIAIHIKKYLMNRELGFIRRTAQIFEELGLSVEHMPSGIDEMSVLIRKSQLTPGKQAALLYRLKTELQADEVHIEGSICLLMLVGEGMVHSVGTTAKAANALAQANINILMINQGSSEISMMFGIQEDKEAAGVEAIYQAFF